MVYVLASDPLVTAGQIAAIILVIELFVFILVGLVLSAVLMFAFAWLRGKAELVKKLRPTINVINVQTELAIQGTPPSEYAQASQVLRAVESIPARVHTVEKQVDQGSQRVTDAVAEFRARTVMAQTVFKAFFLPGLKREPHKLLPGKGPEFQRRLEEPIPDRKRLNEGR